MLSELSNLSTLDDDRFQELLFDVMHEAHARGYAGTVFTPDEVGTVDNQKMSDRMVEMGWDYIHAMTEDDDDAIDPK